MKINIWGEINNNRMCDSCFSIYFMIDLLYLYFNENMTFSAYSLYIFVLVLPGTNYTLNHFFYKFIILVTFILNC